MEVRKGPLPPFPFPCEGQFPQHYKYSAGEGHCQALAELVVTRAGCWLLGLGKPGEGAHLGPRCRALCALPRTPPGGGCWVLTVVHMTVTVCGFVHLIRPGAVAPACATLLRPPVLPLLHLVVVLLLPPPFLVLVLMQVLVLLLMPLVLVHLLLLLFLIVLLPLLATAAVPLLALVQQRAARRETTYPV